MSHGLFCSHSHESLLGLQGESEADGSVRCRMQEVSQHLLVFWHLVSI